jgi:2,3-bisphosphoglycerate-independent phosphoglycerate mutase
LSRKYVIVVPDGAADEPIESLGGKTILESAKKPNMDWISTNGRQGLCRTVPPSLQAGSDVAMMAVLGYDPVRYYSGRAPIEAVAQGIDVGEDDWIFRCNLVTIADGKMADHSAGHISSKEGKTLVDELNKTFGATGARFYPGVGYRHLMVIGGKSFTDVRTQPPHDMIGRKIEDILPRGKNAEFLIDLMARSQQLFDDHEINRVRKDLGENPASSIWLWGQGKKARMEAFERKYGLKGAAITAVDLVRGLAKLISFDLITVPGATGYWDTDYRAKGKAAIEALKDHDIVLVHVEAPDEAGHAGNAGIKKKAVEEIDKLIVGPVLEELKKYPSWRILVMPDHPTPIATQGHSGEPVPFIMAGEGVTSVVQLPFGEANAAQSGIKVSNGFELMEYFIKS